MQDICSKCDTSQCLKRTKTSYGKLPPKEAEATPWDTLCVDLIGKYQFTLKGSGKKDEMTIKSGKKVYLQAVTMIDPATGWVEIRALPGARADYISNQVEFAWLTRYPQPTKIILDRGNEFLAKFKTLIEDDYGITIKPITVQNPQANVILELVHQTISNIIRTMKAQDMFLDDENPWNGILASTMFALRTTVHTTTRFIPMQLVFGRDAVLNTRHEADWHVIKERKQKLINRGNDRENRKRVTFGFNK